MPRRGMAENFTAKVNVRADLRARHRAENGFGPFELHRPAWKLMSGERVGRRINDSDALDAATLGPANFASNETHRANNDLAIPAGPGGGGSTERTGFEELSGERSSRRRVGLQN